MVYFTGLSKQSYIGHRLCKWRICNILCKPTAKVCLSVEIKCQLDATDDFYCRSYCLLNMFRAPLCPSSGTREYYTATAARKPDTQPSAPRHTDNLKTKAPNTTGSNLLYNTLELLMMDIMVPETCWTSSKICNKNHLLHLVGILFLHIKDDARSKSLQIYIMPNLFP